ncbi:hypothetical protein C4565_04085 [Candidatus Parcubacteria bacterium]|jgi:hypothetical protein|nr:MAG: hypothetical protein C4565_04085 [Candidatus Parcubacteria bacterium]
MKRIVLNSATGLTIINALNAITQNNHFTIERWSSETNFYVPEDKLDSIKWEEEKDTLKNITVKAGYSSEGGFNSDYSCIVMSLTPTALAAHYDEGSIFYIYEKQIIAVILNARDRLVYRRFYIENENPEIKYKRYCEKSENANRRMHLVPELDFTENLDESDFGDDFPTDEEIEAFNVAHSSL